MKYHPMSNQELLEELGKSVYGHTSAKKAIINVINRQRMRWHQQFSKGVAETDLIENHNLMLIGPSGTGKTHLVKTMSKLCGFFLVCFDATHIVPVGGKGDVDVLKIIKQIKNEVNQWTRASRDEYTYSEIMAQTVVFIDEIDKLATELYSGSNWNKEAQSSLLKLVDGDDEEIKGVTFIFAGAFTNIFEGIKSKSNSKKQSGIGFTFSSDTKEEAETIDWDDKIVEAGITHELAGRINQVVCLDNLTIDHYYEILHKHILPQHIKEMRVFNPSFYVDEGDNWITSEFSINMSHIDEIVKKAFESGQGVRMLKKKISALFREYEFNFDEDRHVPKENRLTKDVIRFIHGDIEEDSDFTI